MRPQGNQYHDFRLKDNRYGDGWGDYTPGVASVEEESETVIGGHITPESLIRRISANGPDFSNDALGFEWVAGKTAFREWMHKLDWQSPTYTIGWSEK